MAKTINDIVLEFKNNKIEHNNGVLWEMGYREGCQFGAIHGINAVLEIIENSFNEISLYPDVYDYVGVCDAIRKKIKELKG